MRGQTLPALPMRNEVCQFVIVCARSDVRACAWVNTFLPREKMSAAVWLYTYMLKHVYTCYAPKNLRTKYSEAYDMQYDMHHHNRAIAIWTNCCSNVAATWFSQVPIIAATSSCHRRNVSPTQRVRITSSCS